MSLKLRRAEFRGGAVDDRRGGVEVSQRRFEIGEARGAPGLRQKVAFGDNQPVGERDLADAFSVRTQCRNPVHRVDQRRHAGEPEPRREVRVGEKRVQNGRGFGERRRLEHDAGKNRQRARLPPRQDVAQGLDEIAAQGATDATAVDQDGVARQPLIKQMIEPDLAPFVDDHQRLGEFRRAQKPVDQRGLPRAEKPGDDVKSDRVAAGHD